MALRSVVSVSQFSRCPVNLVPLLYAPYVTLTGLSSGLRIQPPSTIPEALRGEAHRVPRPARCADANGESAQANRCGGVLSGEFAPANVPNCQVIRRSGATSLAASPLEMDSVAVKPFPARRSDADIPDRIAQNPELNYRQPFASESCRRIPPESRREGLVLVTRRAPFHGQDRQRVWCPERALWPGPRRAFLGFN